MAPCATTRSSLVSEHSLAHIGGPALYRTTSSGVEMLVGKTWVWVPRAMVEYRSLEGDTGETNGRHWCGEQYEGGFVTYCAFLPPRLLPRPNRAVPALSLYLVPAKRSNESRTTNPTCSAVQW